MAQCRLRNPGAGGGNCRFSARAVQSSPMKCVLPITLVILWLVGPCAMAQSVGSIQGRVTDPSGEPVYGAVVIVEGVNGGRHTTVTDRQGAFQVSSLAPGNYSVKISASGFSDWSATNVPVLVTQQSNPLAAVLRVAPETTTVTVGLKPQEVAAVQLNQELKQRALGVIPNYYVSYESHPAPLTAKQKFHLTTKLLFDPTTIAAVALTAGIQQKENSYYQFGQGAEGFAKRFGADYATASENLLITSVLADSVLHQDPRYFYDGHGTIAQRTWYAFESAFRTKGDNGKWQPPYAGILGSIASSEISQTYLPGSRTQYTLLGRSLMFHFAGIVGVNLCEEFLLPKLTSHKPEASSVANRTVLREGTPVPLIAVEGFDTTGAGPGQTVTFVLANDLTVSGKVVAKAGDVASGEVGQVSRSSGSGKAGSVTLERVKLLAGNVNVPLRSSQARGGGGPIQYRVLPGSGKIEVTLFVAENEQFPGGQ